MAFNINLFQGALKLGGVRPALFQVNMSNPVNGAGDVMIPFMARATQVPAAQLGTVEQWYFGRPLKLAGNRTFAEWTVTIINDEDFIIRNSLEEWSNKINGFQSNVRSVGNISPSSYKGTAQVTQFSKAGIPLRIYNFVGMFPVDVSVADLDWSAVDTIQDFTCTFQYDYWEVSGGITGQAGG
jgi:uncharacterized protein YlzI (FlbEa/FlbD family)